MSVRELTVDELALVSGGHTTGIITPFQPIPEPKIPPISGFPPVSPKPVHGGD